MALRHDAFISYSHAADSKLAAALESGLEKLAKPLLKLRALDVFRDQTSLTASPALWPGIVSHLSASDWLLFFASPASAASVWCNKEVRWWLEHRSPDRVLMVLTEGEIAWDSQARDFDWSRTTSVPKLLSGRCADEPLYVDLRWARGSELLTLRNAQFRDAVVNIAAPIRGVPKDQLDGADLRQLARNRLLVRGGVAAISVAAAVAIWQAIVANQQRAEAERQRDIAVARQFGAQAELMRSQQPERLPLALLMATESARLQPESIEAQQTLRAVVSQFPVQTGVLSHSSAVVSVAFNDDQSRVATAGSDAALWRLPEGTRIASLEGANNLVFFSPDAQRIIGCCERVGVWSRDGVEQLSLSTSDLRGAPRNVSLSGDGRLLAIGVAGAQPGFAVYDFESSKIVARHEIEASGNATAIAFGPKGELFFAPRTEIEVHSTATWSLDSKLEPGIGPLHRLAISSSGRYLAASSDVDVVIFDLEQNKLEATLRASSSGPGTIGQLAFDWSDSYVGAAGSQNTGSIWQIGSWREAVALSHGEFQDIHSLSFDPSMPEAVSCGADGHCLAWSLTDGRPVHQLAHVYPHTGEDSQRPMMSSAFGSRDAMLITGGVDGTARTWRIYFPGGEALSRCLMNTIEVRTFVAKARSWSKDPHYLEPVERECSLPRPEEARYGTMAVSAGAEFAAATMPVDQVRVWNTRSGNDVARLDHSGAVDWDEAKARLETIGISGHLLAWKLTDMKNAGSARVLAVSRSGKHVATFRDADATLRIWNTESNTVLYSEQIGDAAPVIIEFVSDSTLLRVESSGSLSVRNVDGSVMWAADHAELSGVTLSSDGSRVAASAGKPSAELRVRDIASGKIVFEAKTEEEIGDLVFDGSGRYLIALGRYSLVDTGLPNGVDATVWDTRVDRGRAPLSKAKNIIALDFSADQQQLAMMSRNGELRVWDLAKNESRRAVTADPGPVAFSADGRWLAMGGRSVRVLDTKSLRGVAQLDIGGEIRALEFRGEDALIAVRRFDSGMIVGEIGVYRWRPQDMLIDACQRMPVEAATKQWRRLFPEQATPAPCAKLSTRVRRL